MRQPTPRPYGVQPSPRRDSHSSPDERFPWLPKAIGLILILVLLAFLWRFCYQAPLPTVGKLPPPQQTTLPKAISLPSIGGYSIIGTHAYELKALILHRKRYSSGPEAKFSPVDFALGWGIVTMKPYIHQISWSQRGRWANYRYGAGFPLPNSQIIASYSNTHIIPARDNPALRDTLLGFRRGDLVRLKGYLVAIRATKGSWRWVSSTSRTDTAGGACEIMYVTEAERLPIP